jgi:hypothetical protein
LTKPRRSRGVTRIANASTAMSCVAEAKTSTIIAPQNAALAGGTTPSVASASVITISEPKIHVRYVPAASTSGAQKNFSVQMMPTLLMRPMVVRSILVNAR